MIIARQYDGGIPQYLSEMTWNNIKHAKIQAKRTTVINNHYRHNQMSIHAKSLTKIKQHQNQVHR